MKRSWLLVYAVALAGDLPGQIANLEKGRLVHRRFSSYWTTKDKFTSTVKLHNNLVRHGITITPILLLADGSPTELEPIQLGPLGNAEIDVSRALASKQLPEHVEGSFVFRYPGRIGNAISAETLILDREESLSFTIPSYEERPSSRKQHFAWWKPYPGAEVYVAMQNVSDETIRVHPTATVGNRQIPLGVIELGPYHLATLELPDDLDEAGKQLWSRNDLGSLTIEAPPHSLNASGWLDEEDRGFSTMLSFHDPAMAPASKLFGTQILLGPQSDLVSSAVETVEFASSIVLKNVTDELIGLTAQFIYETGSRPTEIILPLQSLAPQEVQRVDLSALQAQGLIPSNVRSGAIKVTHTGAKGALMGRVFSISKDGDYAIYSSLDSFAGPGGSGVFWTAEGTWNTILTVTNFSDKNDTVYLELTYAGGTFRLAPFPLDPLQSRTVNLKEIVDGKVTALDGKVWPREIASGGYKIAGTRVRSALGIKQQSLESESRLSTPFYLVYLYYTACLSQSQYTVAIGKSENVHIDALGYIYGDPTPPSDVCDAYAENGWEGGSLWDHEGSVSISNSSIATLTVNTVDDGGFGGLWDLNGLTEGTATITAQSGSYVIDPYGTQDTFEAQAEVVVLCAYPTNFQQTSATDIGGGVLQFTYQWESNTQRLSDLSACSIGEEITIDGTNNPWPTPFPYFYYATLPTVQMGIATSGTATDNHYTANESSISLGDWRRPFSAKSFVTTQTYVYQCPCRGNQRHNLLGSTTLAISRWTELVNGLWKFTINKNNSQATIYPLQ